MLFGVSKQLVIIYKVSVTVSCSLWHSCLCKKNPSEGGSTIPCYGFS